MTTQTLERAIALLRLLADASPEGCRLAELQRASGLTKPTVHRILDSLRHEGFVEQFEASRRYRLGPELAVLGWSAGRTVYDLKALAVEEMIAVADKTGDTSFLSVRTGIDTVCIDRQSGPYPVKAFAVEVGMRRPLGVGATGLALLAAEEPAEAEAILDSIRDRLGRFPNASLRRIRESLARARRDGYALSDQLMVDGVRGLAVAIRDGRGRAVAAIGTAAIGDRVTAARIPALLKILRMHANRVEQRIAAAESRSGHGSVRTVRTVRPARSGTRSGTRSV